MQIFSLPVRTERELEWYFNVSPGELGVKSSWDALVAIAHWGAPTYSPDTMFEQERHVEQVHRNRKVYSALAKIDAVHRSVLAAAYEARCYPTSLLEFFGDRRLGVALFTPLAKRSAGVHQTVLEFFEGCEDQDLLYAIRAKADELLLAALRAFDNAYS